MSYSFLVHVYLYDTDASGRIFFGRQFFWMQSTYECFMKSIGYPINQVFTKKDIQILVVHAQADFLAPISVGDCLQVELIVEAVKVHSFVISYTFSRSDRLLCGKGKTVHVLVDGQTGEKQVLLEDLKHKLLGYLGGTCE